MANVLLPCEVEEWWEDKRMFLLLSHLRSIKDFDLLISSHVRKDQPETVFSKRLSALKGLREFLSKYCTAEEQKTFLTSTLPCIAKAASFLDERVPGTGIPFLYKQESAALVLGRKLILSLLANAFLCTFPTTGPQSHITPFNFDKFFNVFLQKDESRMVTQAAKLKCILCYFRRVAEDKCNLSSVITLRRQSIQKSEVYSMEDWLSNSFPLCPVLVEEDCLIEDCDTLTLQVDFANKKIGGGVLAGGRVQEEIHFCICPELIISRLIMDHMDPNEAIIITGAERFSSYSGYGYTLKFSGDYVDEAQRDVFGNILTSIVAIDAVSMSNNPDKQYKLDLILRELNKAYVGFQCQQDRGDTSTELLALSVKRSSSAFMGEFNDYGSGQLPVISPGSQRSYLGNITLSQTLVSSEESTPLSPIKELSESPRFTSEPAYTYGDFAQKFTESLLGEVGIKKATHTASKVTETPPPSTSSNLDDLASAISSSIVEAAVHPHPETVLSQQKSPPLTSATKEVSAGTVDELAMALTSSILSSSSPPSVDKDQSQDRCNSTQPSSSSSAVDDLIGSLSSSIIQSSLEACNAAGGKREDAKKSPPPSLSSDQNAEPSISERERGGPGLSSAADSVAKSIIANALSLSSSSAPPPPAQAPKILPLQTSGQSSDSTVCPSSGSEENVFVSLVDQLTDSIISDVLLSQPSPQNAAATSVSSPPLNRPAIFIQVERRGSGGMTESPRSSRSSSITGQTITLHEYTDELVESSCREGVAIALFQTQGQEAATIEEAVPNEGEGEGGKEPQPLPSSSLDVFLDGVVSSSIQDGLRHSSIEVTPDEETAVVQQPTSLSSEAQMSLASTPRVIKQSPVLTRHGLNLAGRKHTTHGSDLSDASSDDGPPQVPSKLLLSTPSNSRMSYAWSTASTRDEDSRPVSPTNLDRIALDLTQNCDEFSNLLSKIIVSEAISTVTEPQSKRKEPFGTLDEGDSGEEQELDINNDQTTSKIDDFLSRLDQASPISEVNELDEGVSYEATNDKENDGRGGGVKGSEVIGAAYPSTWHKMRAMLLRPVATGNWGCGAFKGNPKLKSMIQWAAVSAAGRPQMIYCTFGNTAVKQLSEVTTHLRKKCWTVGELAAAILNYCKIPEEERKSEDVFTFLLKL